MKIVDIEAAKKEFIKYVDKYDLTNEGIERKKNHSLRVMEISNELAKEEQFSEEKIEIATLIGLLHDLARFKQYTEYQTLSDQQSFDHGNMAIKILEEKDYLRKFIQTEKYDEIIKKAIKNHNKPVIEEGLRCEQEKFCKLIRDADKIDILYLATKELWENEKKLMEKSKLNNNLKKEFDREKSIQYSNYKQIRYADQIILFLSYIYDLNYKVSFEIIKKNNYIEKIKNRFEFKDEYTKKEILKAIEETQEYILKKLE